MSHQNILVWFRNDLRSHDCETLYQASLAIQKTGGQIFPVYCFDPRHFRHTQFGFPKTGAFRAKFLIESVANLRENLRSLGSNLIVRIGKPEEVIPDLIPQLEINSIYYHTEVTSEEKGVEKSLNKNLKSRNAATTNLKQFWGSTLLHPDDLPFAIAKLPELFTHFRKQVEADLLVRPPFPIPKLPTLSTDLDWGEIPSLAILGLAEPEACDRAVLQFHGGESQGLQRLEHYFWQSDRLQVYKQTRNGMLYADDSSKFSPWLALGCLSPRYIYAQVKQYESDRMANDSTYWLIFELLWRDYFRFVAAKHGNRIFERTGLRDMDIPWKEDWKRFELWQEGRTGFPLVDANMRELAATGFMSNRGRQNVASFLTKNLGIDWRMGAEWFESLLIDYDPCSNWGNWNYTAGVGNDARGFRFFNINKQAQDYDPQGEYVKHWLPELQELPAGKVHQPWKLLPIEQKRFQVRLGVDYPHPVVDLFASAKANEAIYNSL
ncbi:DASH family cryptochrome [Pseudanabaena sp. FACHB-1998]|uniref:DASH family cryptochrome n=1 Tax=Pseudanabaena sp. FACHB-1998 TaxID=2692858 RepID=UPI001681753A|nr:DASH family cryptochrome [Pseudanabaena sp. FACHB-1998]MBD2175779.1 DASH family cryptochrome [Pseudanabaena sp. FACHB-1998]